MSKPLTLAKIRPAKGGQPSELKNNILYMDSIGSSKETDEYVVMHSSLYKAIFGKTLKSSGRLNPLDIFDQEQDQITQPGGIW